MWYSHSLTHPMVYSLMLRNKASYIERIYNYVYKISEYIYTSEYWHIEDYIGQLFNHASCYCLDAGDDDSLHRPASPAQ